MVKGRRALPRHSLEIFQIVQLKIRNVFCTFLFPSCELSDMTMTLSANSIFIVTGKSFTSCLVWGNFSP